MPFRRVVGHRVIVSSAVYIWLSVRESRRLSRLIWLVRIVRRPSGSYLILNQYLLHPLTAILLALFWTAFALAIRGMFLLHVNPSNLFLWISLSWIPLYLHLSTTTLATLAGANLATTTEGADGVPRHLVGPRTANGVMVAFVVVVTGGLLATGLVGGLSFTHFARSWEEGYQILGRLADLYTADPSMSSDSALVASLSEAYEDTMSPRPAQVAAFFRTQVAATSVYIAVASVLILLNLVGGIFMLGRVRRLQSRVVAPLRPFAQMTPAVLAKIGPARAGAGTSFVVTVDPPTATQATDKDKEKDDDDSRSIAGQSHLSHSDQAKLRLLKWDIVLFFCAVVPCCLIFIGLSSWQVMSLLEIMLSGAKYELMCLGVVWAYGTVAALSMTAMVIKALVASPRAGRRARDTPGKFGVPRSTRRAPGATSATLVGTAAELNARENARRREHKRELERSLGTIAVRIETEKVVVVDHLHPGHGGSSSASTNASGSGSGSEGDSWQMSEAGSSLASVERREREREREEDERRRGEVKAWRANVSQDEDP